MNEEEKKRLKKEITENGNIQLKTKLSNYIGEGCPKESLIPLYEQYWNYCFVIIILCEIGKNFIEPSKSEIEDFKRIPSYISKFKHEYGTSNKKETQTINPWEEYDKNLRYRSDYYQTWNKSSKAFYTQNCISSSSENWISKRKILRNKQIYCNKLFEEFFVEIIPQKKSKNPLQYISDALIIFLCPAEKRNLQYEDIIKKIKCLEEFRIQLKNKLHNKGINPEEYNLRQINELFSNKARQDEGTIQRKNELKLLIEPIASSLEIITKILQDGTEKDDQILETNNELKTNINQLQEYAKKLTDGSIIEHGFVQEQNEIMRISNQIETNLKNITKMSQEAEKNAVQISISEVNEMKTILEQIGNDVKTSQKATKKAINKPPKKDSKYDGYCKLSQTEQREKFYKSYAVCTDFFDILETKEFQYTTTKTNKCICPLTKEGLDDTYIPIVCSYLDDNTKGCCNDPAIVQCVLKIAKTINIPNLADSIGEDKSDLFTAYISNNSQDFK